MAFLGVLSAVASLGASVVGAAGAAKQAEAEQQAADYNAMVLRQQAQQERDAAKVEASDFRRKENANMARAAAARGGTGVTMAGSPLLVDEATVREVALGASRLVYGGEVRANRLEEQAKLSHMSGKAAITAGKYKAGSTLLTGAAKFGSDTFNIVGAF